MKRDLARLSGNVYDVVIIGGGIYGLCVAWDAILRGLSVALVEKGDFGHATSSNTLRIIHGGLRYLQHGDVRRLRQSIHERMVFMRIAPHLVHPLPFLIPTYGHWMRSKEVLSLALLINDLIGLDRNCLQDPQKHLPRGRVVSREECLRLLPGVDERGLTGGAIVYDCQMFSSERLVLSFARSATEAGAEMANYVEAVGFLTKGDRVAGIKARDILTGGNLDIQARIVVNTSGPWLDRVLGLLNGYRSHRRLVLSKAFNILVTRQLVPQYAVGIYSKGRFKDRDAIVSKRPQLFFITPWHDCSLIGTVHLPYDVDPDRLQVSEDETQAFLNEINEAFPGANLKHRDISFAYGGLLPISRNDGSANGVRLVRRYGIRDHKKEEGIDGLVSVIGVKFTEARHVAEKVVDLLFSKLGKKPPKSMTAFTPLYGAQIEQFNTFLAQQLQRSPEGLSTDTIRHLVHRYGSSYPEILKYFADVLSSPRTVGVTSCSEYPSSSGGDALAKAEVLHGIREEMAQKLSDVVFRRAGLGTVGNPGDACLETCAAIMARELGWDGVRTQRELKEVKAVFSTRI
jgi:glycerol-3-phosphate dehydrogenase